MARTLKTPHELTCPACGKRFSTTHYKKVYCTRACYHESKRKHEPGVAITCDKCGKPFVPKRRNNRTYLCPECRSYKKIESNAICKTCGKPFTRNSKYQKFCYREGCSSYTLRQMRGKDRPVIKVTQMYPHVPRSEACKIVICSKINEVRDFLFENLSNIVTNEDKERFNQIRLAVVKQYCHEIKHRVGFAAAIFYMIAGNKISQTRLSRFMSTHGYGVSELCIRKYYYMILKLEGKCPVIKSITFNHTRGIIINEIDKNELKTETGVQKIVKHFRSSVIHIPNIIRKILGDPGRIVFNLAFDEKNEVEITAFQNTTTGFIMNVQDDIRKNEPGRLEMPQISSNDILSTREPSRLDPRQTVDPANKEKLVFKVMKRFPGKVGRVIAYNECYTTFCVICHKYFSKVAQAKGHAYSKHKDLIDT